jgi:hypothetical protein
LINEGKIKIGDVPENMQQAVAVAMTNVSTTTS